MKIANEPATLWSIETQSSKGTHCRCYSYSTKAQLKRKNGITVYIIFKNIINITSQTVTTNLHFV